MYIACTRLGSLVGAGLNTEADLVLALAGDWPPERVAGVGMRPRNLLGIS